MFKRCKEILQTEGLIPFIRRAFLFLVGFVFSCQTYYIYEKTLNETNEVNFMPRLENVSLKIISTEERVNEVIAEGYDIGVPTDIKERLSKGSILCCVLIGEELAHMNWVAMTEEAKRDIDSLPFQIDFQSEVCVGRAETKPRYRGLGIYTYAYAELYQFLRAKGWSKARFTVQRDNTAPQKAQAKLGSKLCGEGRLTKVLLWEFWKEKPAASKAKLKVDKEWGEN